MKQITVLCLVIVLIGSITSSPVWAWGGGYYGGPHYGGGGYYGGGRYGGGWGYGRGGGYGRSNFGFYFGAPLYPYPYYSYPYRITIRLPSSPCRSHRRSTSSNLRRLPNKIQAVTGIIATTPKAIILISKTVQTVGNKLSRHRPHLPLLVKESRYVTFFQSVSGCGYSGCNRLRQHAQRSQCYGTAWYRNVFRSVS